MYLNKGVVYLVIFMSSIARVSSFTTTVVGSFLRRNTHGAQELRVPFSTSGSFPWDRSAGSSEPGKIRSNRFKQPRATSGSSLSDGRFSGEDGRDDGQEREFSSRRGNDDGHLRQEKEYTPRQFSRTTTTDRRSSYGKDQNYRRKDSYSNDRSSKNDYSSRRSEPYNNDRRASFRGNSDSGSYNSYSDKRYAPSYSYDRDEKTEPIYGYYEGDHLYGVTSVKLALTAGRRVIKELLVQSGMDMANKKDAKAAQQILDIAQEKNIPVREFSKHDLNMLSDNRPHQGFILRAQPLEFTSLTILETSQNYSCVLALDEVWDPQNFGALLRTAYFLRCDKVVVCRKNSAPLSAAVSRASAGAMEVMPVYSTDNMMKFLDKSKENGWQVVGTDLSPKSVSLYEVPRTVPTILVLGNEGHGIRTNILRRCTHLVRLGQPLAGGLSVSAGIDSEASEAEGVSDGVDIEESAHAESTVGDAPVEVAMEVKEERGGRFARAIKRPVRVHLELESADDGEGGGSEEAVDSLNVSVTGAIILHHFLASKQQ